MQELFIPVTGMAPDDVSVSAWFKQPGDAIAAGEVVAVIETSKAQLEITSESAGVLGAHLVQVDQEVSPGTVIARVLGKDEADESAEDVPSPSAVTGPPVETTERAQGGIGGIPVLVDGAVGPGSAAGDRPHQLSPRQRRLAAEQAQARAEPEHPALDVPEPPVGNPVPPPPAHPALAAAGSTEASPSDRAAIRHRQAISAAVSRSWQEIPHFAVTRELRVDGLVAAVADLRSVLSTVTLTDLLLRAVALSFIEREGRSDVDLGLAVATERGVSIPVVRNVAQLDLVQLVRARRAAVERAKDGRLHEDDTRSPVTTLSNLGAVGVDQFTGVVPYGQTCLVTVGRAAPRPVVENGRLAVATTMQATLNLDHRSWDGLHAGMLLARIAGVIARPALLAPLGPPVTGVTEMEA